jgi:hypothetical protein
LQELANLIKYEYPSPSQDTLGMKQLPKLKTMV